MNITWPSPGDLVEVHAPQSPFGGTFAYVTPEKAGPMHAPAFSVLPGALCTVISLHRKANPCRDLMLLVLTGGRVGYVYVQHVRRTRW